MSRGISRRDAFRALAGLSLVACDTANPRSGVLGFMERVNARVQRGLLHDVELATDAPLTREGAFPVYHVGPGVPQAPAGWSLNVGGMVANPRKFSVDDLKQLPRTTVRIEHHCVEGWSAVAEWTGVRLSELAKAVGAKSVGYLDFKSFDVPQGGERGYWSSWDVESAMHAHSMIAYGRNGKDLTPEYGAPVRLYGSIKLGYKNVKYLTDVNFLDQETGGYWEAKGYEWFAGV